MSTEQLNTHSSLVATRPSTRNPDLSPSLDSPTDVLSSSTLPLFSPLLHNEPSSNAFSRQGAFKYNLERWPGTGGYPPIMGGSGELENEDDDWKLFRASPEEWFKKTYPGWSEESAHNAVEIIMRTLFVQLQDPSAAEDYEEYAESLRSDLPYLSDKTVQQLYVYAIIGADIPEELGHQQQLELFIWEDMDEDDREWITEQYPEVMEKRDTLSRDEFEEWYWTWIEQRKEPT